MSRTAIALGAIVSPLFRPIVYSQEGPMARGLRQDGAERGLTEQGDLGVEAIALSRKAHAVDGAIDGKTAHMGEHEVGEGNDVKRGSLGVLGPRRGQRDGEWGARHGGRAEHRADLVEG